MRRCPFKRPAIDQAIRDALIDFYTTGGDLITKAVAEFQQARQDGHADQRRELTAVQKELTTTQAAIDRYLTAFETGAMDPDIRKPRLAELSDRAKQLRARQTELTVDLDTPPAAPAPRPTPGSRTHPPHRHQRHCSRTQEPLRSLIDHIEINSDYTFIPVYRVPMTTTPNGPAPDRAEPAPTGHKRRGSRTRKCTRKYSGTPHAVLE